VAAQDPRLTRLSRICRALPEATRELAGRHARFAVRDRTFAWFLDDHHGDGVVAVSCKVVPEQAAALLAEAPDRVAPSSYTGGRGWLTLRLDRGQVDWDEIAELVTGSYRLVAPKRLAATLAARRPPPG
jgi:predicted DNA-binding protein (MmcQ/YjbR family)